jgi:hypothetical protein
MDAVHKEMIKHRDLSPTQKLSFVITIGQGGWNGLEKYNMWKCDFLQARGEWSDIDTANGVVKLCAGVRGDINIVGWGDKGNKRGAWEDGGTDQDFRDKLKRALLEKGESEADAARRAEAVNLESFENFEKRERWYTNVKRDWFFEGLDNLFWI